MALLYPQCRDDFGPGMHALIDSLERCQDMSLFDLRHDVLLQNDGTIISFASVRVATIPPAKTSTAHPIVTLPSILFGATM